MSSWLDTKFLGSLAKNAIAEAQKTLDKALDIKDDEADDQFDDAVQAQPVKPVHDPVNKSGSSTLVKSLSNNLGVSGWGSFTGSFFEAAELTKDKSGNEGDDEDGKGQKSKSKKRQTSSERASSESFNIIFIFILSSYYLFDLGNAWKKLADVY